MSEKVMVSSGTTSTSEGGTGIIRGRNPYFTFFYSILKRKNGFRKQVAEPESLLTIIRNVKRATPI